MTRDISAHYTFGGGNLDGKALDNALDRTVDYPIDSLQYASSGAGLQTAPTERGWVAGVEGHTIVDQDGSQGYDIAVGLGYGLVNMGYAFRLGPLRLFPLIGVGGGGVGLDVSKPGLPDLRASRTNFLLHLGGGADFRIGGRFGLTVGVRVGYVFAPFSQREGIRGGYLRFVFGSHLTL